MVIGFAGKIGSGKTTVSTVLAELLGWPRVGFGDYVRSVARQREIEDTRASLQQLGESLLAEGAEGFCRKVLSLTNWQPGQPTIVDGIRHQEVAQQLRLLAHPLKFVLIFITLDETARQARLLKREANHPQPPHSVEAHSTEAQVSSLLPNLADVIVDGAEEPTAAARRICSELKLNP